MTSVTKSIRRHLAAGALVSVLLTGGVAGWAATTKLAGAVIASGRLVVESDVKKVQHPNGGVVGDLLVSEGEEVHAGQVLVRLDETQTRANLAIVRDALDEMLARRARLRAEREGAETIVFARMLQDRADDPNVARITHGEQRLFDLRRTSRAGQKAQLRERSAQLTEEIGGLDAQINAKGREIALIAKELAGVRELYSQNLIQLSRLTALEREAARLEGERGQLVAAKAKARGRITEIALQVIQVDQDLRSEVAGELAQVRAKITELEERKVAAEDQLRRVDIRAPQDGTVHQLSVHTVGGVIGAGETIMLIVPAADALMADARIQPRDIDQLHLGQSARLRLTAANQRSTPEIVGKVSRIAADLMQDKVSGQSYYLVRVTIPDSERARLGDLALVPGMPVDAFFQTTERSVLSFLVKPLADYAARTFREG